MHQEHQPANTIDQVLEELERIIEWAERRNSRLGYFPALYRKVTLLVKSGIEECFFDDGNRMERLDVIFANRYLEAFFEYQAGKTVTLSWQLAFDAAENWPPIMLQYLLLGMNAHILLDLGIAAAGTVSSDNLPALRDDFDRINIILASQIDSVQNELSLIWPLFRPLDIAAGKVDELLARFSIKLNEICLPKSMAMPSTRRRAPTAMATQGMMPPRKTPPAETSNPTKPKSKPKPEVTTSVTQMDRSNRETIVRLPYSLSAIPK